jgi:hypothetical protein
MIRPIVIAGCVLSTILVLGASVVGDGDQRQKSTKRGKREVPTAEQIQQLKQHAQRSFDERKAAQGRKLEQLKASEEKFRALERDTVNKENAAMRSRAGAFKAAASDARYDAIEREARELSRRARTATAAERAAIDRRAAALLAELRGRETKR